MKQEDRLFPPYLNRGSEGGAVDILHCLLFALGLGKGIQRDGVYGEITTNAVMELQRHLGFPEDEADGNFGPQTRQILNEAIGIDVEAIPYEEGLDFETKWYGPDSSDPQEWPPLEDVDGEDSEG